jgi:tetratricopeptide (TPR) repeat protein
VWSAESGENEIALRLTVAMGRFWFMRGYWMEALEAFWRVYDRTPDADPILRARAVYATAAIQLIVVGQTVELVPLIEDAHTVLSENGSPSDVAFATYFLGVAKAVRGDSEAVALLDLSIRLFAEAADAWGEAYARRWLGTSIELSGDAERSALMQRDAVRGFERLGDRWSAGWMAFDLGFSLVTIGDLDAAQLAFDKSLRLVEELDDRLVVPHAKRGAALVASRAGRFGLAKQLFSEALPILEQIGDENCINLTYMYLGDVEVGVGNPAEAKAHLTRSIQGFADRDNVLGLATALRRMGILMANPAPNQAVQVLAAAEAMRVGAGGSMGPHDRTTYDQALHTLRATLGDDSFDRFWASGERLSQREAIEHALHT